MYKITLNLEVDSPERDTLWCKVEWPLVPRIGDTIEISINDDPVFLLVTKVVHSIPEINPGLFHPEGYYIDVNMSISVEDYDQIFDSNQDIWQT